MLAQIKFQCSEVSVWLVDGGEHPAVTFLWSDLFGLGEEEDWLQNRSCTQKIFGAPEIEPEEFEEVYTWFLS